MTWEDFYDKFYEWADSTQVRKISELTTFGSHEQVAEVILMYVNEKAASRLAKKALAAGVRFTSAEIVEMDGSVSKDCLNQMVKTVLGDFNQEQVESLTYSIDDDLQADLEKRYCHYEFDDDVVVEEPEPARRQKKPGKLFGLFALAGMAAEAGEQKKAPRFRVGDHVRVRWRGQEGTIIDINGECVIEKLKAFFEKFFGIGGSFSADAHKEVNYSDAVSEQPVLIAADDSEPYDAKK